jgi:hypothetical protein
MKRFPLRGTEVPFVPILGRLSFWRKRALHWQASDTAGFLARTGRCGYFRGSSAELWTLFLGVLR